MKSIFYVISLYILLVTAAGSSPAYILNDENLPPQFEATYDVYKGSMRVGEMQISLRKNGDEVIYESTTVPVGLAAFFLGEQEFSDHAVLKLFDDNYRTIEFKHVMKGSDKNRDEHYTFDWVKKQADVAYKDRKSILEIPPHTFDNFSMQLLLMRKPDNQNAENIYSVISKGRLKEYVYKLDGNESVDTKLGKLNANKYVRKKNDDKKTTYLGWYAESLHYLPVKLDKIENGKIDISIQISSVEWL